ncbi:MAG: NFACT family protein [Nanoarchaeota archaeon]
MKRKISSLDLHFLLKELEVLVNSRIDKIYQPDKQVIIFSFYKTNVGKKLLRIETGKSMFLTEGKEESLTLDFGMLLRKHLEWHFLVGVEQIKPERILRISFESKDDKKYLYVEFFGKGNAILCNENNTIINSLEQHDFSTRSIRPKLKYTYPIMNTNLFDIDKGQLSELLKNSKKDFLVTCLATELGLGGLYSEEVCLLSNADKNINPKYIDDAQAQSILDSIKRLINSRIDAKVIFDENHNAIDYAPFELKFYEKHKKKEFSSFSNAIAYFHSQFKEIEESASDKKIRELERIIETQKQAVEQLRKEEHEMRQKGELIYQNYQLIKEILDELNKASKNYSWKEIKEKLKAHKIIKEVNDKDRNVVVEV